MIRHMWHKKLIIKAPILIILKEQSKSKQQSLLKSSSSSSGKGAYSKEDLFEGGQFQDLRYAPLQYVILWHFFEFTLRFLNDTLQIQALNNKDQLPPSGL